MPLEAISLFLPGESWQNGEKLYSVQAHCITCTGITKNNSYAQIFIVIIEVLSVFCFALNKALHSVIQFSGLTGAKKKGCQFLVQHGGKIKEKLDATNQMKGTDT